MRLGGEPPRQESVNLPAAAFISALSIAGVSVAVFFLAGLGSIEVTEYGLCSSRITRKVSTSPYLSGRYWIGPLSHFIRFPAVVKTIQFSDASTQSDLSVEEQGNPMLNSRTHDGLDVSVELSFQYKLKQESIYDLYTTMGDNLDFHETFTRIAIDRLTEVATRYTANEFFVKRTEIGKNMETVLREVFEKRLFATIFSFQLRSVLLPTDFEEAIQRTEVKKQDVHKAEAERNSTRVSMETELLQATRRTQVKSNSADAYAQSVILANSADISQFNKTQEFAAESYKGVLEALDTKESDLLQYIQSRVLRDHPSAKTTVALSLQSQK